MSRLNQFLLGLALVGLAGCNGNGTVIGSGATPTSPPVTPSVTYEYTVPTAASSPWTIVSGPDGNLYFTEFAASKIAKLTTGGTFTEVATPTSGAQPADIIVGPDRALWFTEAAVGKIGSVSPATFDATDVKEYAVPWSSHPNFISRGPTNTTLYFTDTTANAIGAVTTSGTFSGPYTIPTASSNPNCIAVGPDNKMWFVEQATGKIGIFDPANPTAPMQEIPLSSASANPICIVLGPDGAMWFTENTSGAPKLGRITAAHVYSEIPLPGAQSAYTLSVDFYGDAIIVTDPTGNKIGVYAISSNKFTEYAANNPFFVTLGPDGKMYFTENANNKIGQFSYF